MLECWSVCFVGYREYPHDGHDSWDSLIRNHAPGEDKSRYLDNWHSFSILFLFKAALLKLVSGAPNFSKVWISTQIRFKQPNMETKKRTIYADC